MRIAPTREDMIELTAGWDGDRFDDGRPRVDDAILAELAGATTEQAWSVLREHEFHRQFAGGWMQTHPGNVLVGRAVTAQFLPHRPDYDAAVVAAGAREGHMEGDKQNSWVIQTLGDGDVMVVDIFGKVYEGTVVGDNLGTAVASRTHAGAVIDGGARDLQGIMELEGVNFFLRGVDPTPIRNVTLAGINLPIRVGTATVLPGDVVLGTPTGVIFIPPQLAAEAAASAAEIRLRDKFGKARLAAQVYTSAQIDVGVWAPEIEADFVEWRSVNGS
ncbi:MAG TPA: hypothetical protein VKV06_00710 [Acidimicrobiales bacterium]|nr:hypothetical protein [Acidimicrobiales bacterium]